MYALPPSRRILLACSLIVGCGTANDQEGDTRTPRDDTRYEIVIVDSSGQPGSERPIAEEGLVDAPVEPPPPPGIDDEAGGDDIVAFDPQGSFVIQVGVYSQVAKARVRVRQLIDLGYPAFLVKRASAAQIRVRIGFFRTRDDADHFGQRFVRDHGGEFWIDRRTEGEG